MKQTLIGIGVIKIVFYLKGDPDIYCYLLRKSDNGVYKEHTRNRESCSFIVNDVNMNKLNEFWIYSSNKHGHNKDSGVYLTIGQSSKRTLAVLNVIHLFIIYFFRFVCVLAIQQGSTRNWMILGIIAVIVIFILLICCFSFKLKKGISETVIGKHFFHPNFILIYLTKTTKMCEDNDSMFESDNYQQSRGIMSSSPTMGGMKKLPNGIGYYPPTKMLKSVRMTSQENMFESTSEEHHQQQKYVKIDFYPPPSQHLTNGDDDFKQEYTDMPCKKEAHSYGDVDGGGLESNGVSFYDSKTKSKSYQSEYKSINEELKRKQKERTLLLKTVTSQSINKSTSFSASKSSSPQTGSETGLLATVDQNSNGDSALSSSGANSDKSSSSLCEVAQANVTVSGKMVTFSSNSMSRKSNNKVNSSSTAETGSTIVAGAGNEHGSASNTSNASNASTVSTGTSASPSVSSSSANNDLDISHEAPLTVSDQSFILQRPSKLTMSNKTFLLVKIIILILEFFTKSK